MTDFVLEDFEVVGAPGGTRLARVAGRWDGPSETIETLVVDTGREARHVPPLPGPPPTGAVWRAAFALPAELAQAPRPAYALALASGALLDLPRPRVREIRRPAPAPPPVEAPAVEAPPA